MTRSVKNTWILNKKNKTTKMLNKLTQDFGGLVKIFSILALIESLV